MSTAFICLTHYLNMFAYNFPCRYVPEKEEEEDLESIKETIISSTDSVSEKSSSSDEEPLQEQISYIDETRVLYQE